MVIHYQGDWRALEDSLALDVSLVESVFYGLSKEYDKWQRERERRLSGHQPEPNDNNNNDEDDQVNMNQLDEVMFAKADVLLRWKMLKGISPSVRGCAFCILDLLACHSRRRGESARLRSSSTTRSHCVPAGRSTPP